MPELPYLFTLLITAWTVGGPAAFALTKPSAERNGHVLVIDRGDRRGTVDAQDDLVDLAAECGGDRDRQVTLRKAELATNEPDGQSAVARWLLAVHGLPPLNANIVQSFRGPSDGPLVLIYPENHLEYDRGAGNLALHQRGTDEVVRLAETLLESGRTPVNLVEYPFGQVRPLLNLKATSAADRARKARAIVTRSQVSVGFALAELFGDLVRTVSVDDPALNTKEDAAQLALELKASAAYLPGRSYLGVLDMRMDQRGLGRFVGDQATYSFFRDMLDRDRAGIIQAQNEICEARSRIMGDQVAAALAPDSIAFLQIGALHVHGVRQRLLERGISYLILSP